jgi:biopolymer transport protein ExbB
MLLTDSPGLAVAAAPAQESPQLPTASPPSAVRAEAQPARGESSPPGPQNTLRWLYDSLGWFYVAIFLGISFALVALVVMNVLALRRENIVPAHLVAGLAAHLDDQSFPEAYDLAKHDDSFLGHVLAAGMAKVSAGYDAATQAMQDVGDEGHLKLQHQVGYLALIAQIGPLVGLLCSVEGMIEAFAVIASKNVTPKPWELAQGIGLALVSTLVGLWIAIPAIALHHYFRCRLSRLMLEAATTAENLMARLRGEK